MTVIGMLLIVGVAVLVLLAVRWFFGQPASGSANPQQYSQDAPAEGN